MANSIRRPDIQARNVFQRRTPDSHGLHLTMEPRDTGMMNGDVNTGTLRRKSLKEIVGCVVHYASSRRARASLIYHPSDTSDISLQHGSL